MNRSHPETLSADGIVLDSVATSSDTMRSWPVWLAALAAPFLPSTVGSQTTAMRLRTAWLIHFFFVLLCVQVIMLFIALGEGPDRPVHKAFFIAWRNAAAFPAANPVATGAAVVGIFFLTQLFFITVSFFLMPWGAKDEPVKLSFFNALRQAWLHTGHIALGIMLVGSVALLFDRADQRWRSVYPRPQWPVNYPTPVTLAPGDPGYAAAKAEYHSAMKVFGEEQVRWSMKDQVWRRERPWYLRWADAIGVSFGFLSGLWLLWSLLRGIGAPRDGVATNRPPLCEWCGYNLTTMPLESRCPECGVAVIDSLGEHVRPGIEWQSEYGGRSWSAIPRCALNAIRSPLILGRRIRVNAPEAHHRQFLTAFLPVVFFTIAIGVPTSVSIKGGLPSREDWAEVASIMAGIGIVGVVGTIVLVNLVALLCGLAVGRHERRNLMPASIQVASYLSGYLALWVLFAFVSLAGFFWLEEEYFLDAPARFLRIDREVLVFTLWLLPNAALGILYLVFVSRGTAAARFANR